jgi:hypothetical protein
MTNEEVEKSKSHSTRYRNYNSLIMRELTVAEYILADIVLLKIELNTDFRMQRYLHNVTIGLYDSHPEDICKEICEIVVSRNSIIEDFLRIQGYIKFTDPSTHLYILTQKGEDAQKCGGHKQYLDWVEKEKEKSKKGEIPKQNTIIYDTIKIVIPLIAGIFIGRYACNQPSKTDNDQSKDQPKTQVVIQDTFRKAPEILNKRDSSLTLTNSPSRAVSSDTTKK